MLWKFLYISDILGDGDDIFVVVFVFVVVVVVGYIIEPVGGVG